MKSHELAKILLENPDMDISTFANNHFAKSEEPYFGNNTRIGILKSGERESILIENFDRKKYKRNE